jgi:hypothetical protein
MQGPKDEPAGRRRSRPETAKTKTVYHDSSGKKYAALGETPHLLLRSIFNPNVISYKYRLWEVMTCHHYMQ